MKIPRLLQAVLVFVGIYATFKIVFGPVLGQPIPSSLLTMYMFFVVAGLFMVFTFNDESVRELTAPIKALVEDPARKPVRNVVFVIVPLLAGGYTFNAMLPDFDAPVELRSIHPAPPSTVEIFGRRYDLSTLENPYRELEKDDPGQFRQLVAEGAEVYIRNCHYCHGDKLDGDGPYAEGLNPVPLNFQDVGTIAQLQESYLFWRIATGGPGLPLEAAPWVSSMPAWEEFLSEEEVWKVILFLYDYTGHEPRTWEQETVVAAPGGGSAAVDHVETVSGVEQIYAERCSGCHGEEGDGLGAAAERLNPPPRDFTLGLYKFKSSGFDEYLPNDDDLLRMIRDGMAGTAMPGWGDVLSDQEMADLVVHIKTLAGYAEDETPARQVEFGTQIANSAESIEIGKKLFLDGDRCSECHGIEGKGDATKNLKDDNGERTWPRNLTKPWTFRAGNDPREIYTRISTGIPGTQMPSFADPVSDKVLSAEERWHVANYVSSLAKTGKIVRPDNTVVKAAKLDGDVPGTPDDPVWQQAESSTFFLVPQILAEDRLFRPSNDTISVSALYNAEKIALLLEWDDRTRSIPGDETAEKIADAQDFEDSVAIQFPLDIPRGMEKPYFGMGDSTHAVNIWQWNSGTTDEAEAVRLINARGSEDVEQRDAAEAGIQATGTYQDGTWRVVIDRPLVTPAPEQDVQFPEGRFVPLALAAWDGSNGENGARHTMTGWYWLLLEPSTGPRPVIFALIAIALIVIGQLTWARSATHGKTPSGPGKEQ